MTHHTRTAHYFSFGVKGGVRFLCSHVLTCFHKVSNMFSVFLRRCCQKFLNYISSVNPIETLKLHEMLKFYTTENKQGIVEDITYDFFPSHHYII